MTDTEKAKVSEFYEEKKSEWEQKVKTAEARTRTQMRNDAQDLKDKLYCVANALADEQSFSDVQIKNIRHWISGMYDELTRLGLMKAGELRYRENTNERRC